MAQLTVQTTDRIGTVWNVTDNGQAAAAGGDFFANGSQPLLQIVNGGGSDITLTVALGVNNTIDGLVTPNKTITIKAGKEYILGPFPTTIYSDSNGNCQLTYSAVTSVKVQPFIPTAS